MKHQLRSITISRPRAILLAAAGITTVLLTAPAAAGCHPLDELPAAGVPEVPLHVELSTDLRLPKP